MGILDIITGGFGIIKGIIDNKKARQEKQQEIDLRKIEKQGELDIANQQATTDYDIQALKQSERSWKDEYLTILLSLPVIGSFIPGVQDSVVLGWDYLAKAPVWFQVAFIGVIAATFGLRWLFGNVRGKEVQSA
ncbi:hypothetical protein FP507_08745 [Chlorobium phaeovibrioides]|uniref:Holin n=1 Tax=Chlorobium phaeovibrioides TaxID=1094 RepID=A0A5M8ICH2_CHLPH|nr:hypothetical protein [Chlorobium phaeovibrioides]KAA6233116.1 hypothetical protein FP507_08745 [Chlorobium phaeovibrioides]